jgi:hypothetical protein
MRSRRANRLLCGVFPFWPAVTPRAARAYCDAGVVHSAPVRLDCADNRDSTEHKKDRAENRVIHNPGNPCTNERQGGNKARSRVSTSISAPEGQRLSFPSPVRESMALDRVCRSPTRQVGRPSFWERPSRAPPDRKVLPREV